MPQAQSTGSTGTSRNGSSAIGCRSKKPPPNWRRHSSWQIWVSPIIPGPITPHTWHPGCASSRTILGQSSRPPARLSRRPIGCTPNSLKPRRWQHDQHYLQWRKISNEGLDRQDMSPKLGRRSFAPISASSLSSSRDQIMRPMRQVGSILSNDRRVTFSAAAHAQRAVAYLHSLQPQAESEREAA